MLRFKPLKHQANKNFQQTFAVISKYVKSVWFWGGYISKAISILSLINTFK